MDEAMDGTSDISQTPCTNSNDGIKTEPVEFVDFSLAEENSATEEEIENKLEDLHHFIDIKDEAPNLESDCVDMINPQFKCSVCKLSFTDHEQLGNHGKVHLAKLFECDICDYKATQKSNLVDHIRTHTGDKLFACEISQYKFAQKHLTRHLKINVHMLLELIQKYNFLYDKSRKDFKDVQKKNNAWVEIGEALNCGELEVKTRWRTLRERFTKEVKDSQLKGRQNASEASTWEWFEAMSFLEKHVKPRRTASSRLNPLQSVSPPRVLEPSVSTERLSNPEIMILSDEDDNRSNITLPQKIIKTSSPKSKKALWDEETKKRKRVENENLDDQILASLKRLDKHIELNEDDIFCKAVAFELKKITNLEEKQRVKAKIYLLATGIDKSTL